MKIKDIKPSYINTENHFWGAFGNNEAETVARILVDILKELNNDFSKTFTYNDIKHRIVEERHLNYIKDYIEKNDNEYKLNEKFVRRIVPFMN
jgi:hypothetical protein